MTTKTFNVTGMKCMGCVSNVEKALNALDGVASAKADLTAKTATVDYEETKVGFAQMQETVEKLGFEVTE